MDSTWHWLYLEYYQWVGRGRGLLRRGCLEPIDLQAPALRACPHCLPEPEANRQQDC